MTRADVDTWHKARGWKGIGYHYLVRIDGTIERGRAISQPGSHCLGHNAHSICIAYAGGTDAAGHALDTRTEAQKAALLKLLATLVKMYHCPVHGHRDYAHTDCPSFDASREYEGLYRQLALPKSG